MKPVVTTAEMRALDRATIDDIGLPAVTLMETAGRAVADAALRMLDAERGHVAVVCGPGNNGGDGFVAGRVLRDRGIDAVVYLAAERTAVRGDAKMHLDVFERSGGIVRMIATPARCMMPMRATARLNNACPVTSAPGGMESGIGKICAT